jgi:D-threo-aldose 1-dehydrogenase
LAASFHDTARKRKNLSNQFLSDKFYEFAKRQPISLRSGGELMISVRTKRRVGATGLELPVFGFGSAHIGELYGPVEESVARETLQAAWDGGIRYFDTAPWYGRGLSEHRLGSFLRTQPREEFQISTKVGRTLHRPPDPAQFDRSPWVGGLNFEVKFDYSRDGILRSYEQALQRLALDTVDCLVIHDLDAAYHDVDDYARHRRELVESGIPALEELKRSSDIKAFGMGINTNEAFEVVAPGVDVDFFLVAMPYTLAEQGSLHRGMADCVKRGISVVVGAPFASGILATGAGQNATYGYSSAPEEMQKKVRDISDVADRHGVSLPSAALQFPLAHPAVVSTIPGAAKASEVIQNCESLSAEIPDAFWQELKERGLIVTDAPVPVQGGQ